MNICRERFTRVKHAMGLRAEHIDLALADAGLTFSDVDYCAVSTSQGYPATFFKGDDLSVSYLPDADTPIPFAPALASRWPALSAGLRGGAEGVTRDYAAYIRGNGHRTQRIFVDQADDIDHCLPTTENYVGLRAWQEVIRIDQIQDRLSPEFLNTIAHENVRHGLHFPASVSLRGVAKPAIVCSHHAAHAASAFYMSDKELAAILTVDGSTPSEPGSYKGGMFYIGRGTEILPVWPHGLGLGSFYGGSSRELGFGRAGEGKFMGLAPYGRPVFMDDRFVGCIKSILEKLALPGDYFTTKNRIIEDWIAHCRAGSEAAGHDLSGFGDAARLLDPANADFAASSQRVFEETLLHAVRELAGICRKLGLETTDLCLAGGSMLNCPANSRIANETPFQRIHIVPGCDDSGIAVGAALFLAHNVLGLERAPQNPETTMAAYLGRRIARQEITAALDKAGDAFQVTEMEQAAEDAGRALAANKIVAWFEGRSEFGPRALGHRSLLADPRDAKNWARVNQVKSREQWRPFAPAVLEERQHAWFDACPAPTPFMLFTGQVRRSDLPAITHLDGSSRIQSVARDCGGYRRLIEAFDAETNCPVVMNTSLNGPAEPIVEAPEQALSFLANTEADVLYMDGYRVTRRDDAADT